MLGDRGETKAPGEATEGAGRNGRSRTPARDRGIRARPMTVMSRAIGDPEVRVPTRAETIQVDGVVKIIMAIIRKEDRTRPLLEDIWAMQVIGA